MSNCSLKTRARSSPPVLAVNEDQAHDEKDAQERQGEIHLVVVLPARDGLLRELLVREVLATGGLVWIFGPSRVARTTGVRGVRAVRELRDAAVGPVSHATSVEVVLPLLARSLVPCEAVPGHVGAPHLQGSDAKRPASFREVRSNTSTPPDAREVSPSEDAPTLSLPRPFLRDSFSVSTHSTNYFARTVGPSIDESLTSRDSSTRQKTPRVLVKRVSFRASTPNSLSPDGMMFAACSTLSQEKMPSYAAARRCHNPRRASGRLSRSYAPSARSSVSPRVTTLGRSRPVPTGLHNHRRGSNSLPPASSGTRLTGAASAPSPTRVPPSPPSRHPPSRSPCRDRTLPARPSPRRPLRSLGRPSRAPPPSWTPRSTLLLREAPPPSPSRLPSRFFG